MIYVTEHSSMFSARSFIVSRLTFKSLIHFEFVFPYDIRECSNFTLLHVTVQFSQHWLLKRLFFLHMQILSNIQRRVNTYSSEILSKNSRGRNTPKLLLWGYYHPDTKTRQRYHQRRKLLTNIFDEYRHKNFNKILAIQIQQHIEKIIYTMTRWDSSQVHKDGKTYANQCHTPH